MRILITGATGYVRSWLFTALLAGGHHVVAATRNRSQLKRFGWYGDIDALELVNLVPGPMAAVLRTGPDILTELAPNGKSA